MTMQFLDFEQPIAEMQARVEELRLQVSGHDVNINEEIDRLNDKCVALTESIFSKLTPDQVSKMARHPERPYTLDYIDQLFTEFQELHGDRAFADDAAIVGGLARLDGRPVMVIGQQKGRTTTEKVARNFGMAKPEGYRKAKRLMEQAQRFNLPLITFIDTPGAYPGIDAEERGQSAAIAENLYLLSGLTVPIICLVIGEGGSGGALAIGVGDHLAMLEYSTYSVISPEGCAAILWGSNDKADLAAQAMGITAPRLLELGLIDKLIEEPLGGAHRDADQMAASLKSHLLEVLDQLEQLPVDQLIAERAQRLAGYGVYNDPSA